jgi:ketosteroid isomerase-like protein
MPDEARTRYAILIERFGESWEKGDAAGIAGVFSGDAVFVPEPFATPITGRGAISDYWKDLPFEQSEVSFRCGEVYAAGPWFATEFKCTFRRRRSGEPVDVRGALFCETADGEITEMRMYWARRVE